MPHRKSQRAGSGASANVSSAGYRKRYGYLTLVNYWLERQPRNDQTPDLWMTSEQPVTAVKDAVSLFLAFVQEVDTDDQVGLVIYTAANGRATLETGLTGDMQLVEDVSRRRQAGHYDYYTNIAAGLREARLELVNNGRPASHKLIVLMTDGIANRPVNSTVARNAVNNEAQLTADAGLPVVTISLGTGADQALMQRVADTTSGVHFNVPADGTVSQYEDELKDVFRQIAEDRHLTLVK